MNSYFLVSVVKGMFLAVRKVDQKQKSQEPINEIEIKIVFTQEIALFSPFLLVPPGPVIAPSCMHAKIFINFLVIISLPVRKDGPEGRNE